MAEAGVADWATAGAGAGRIERGFGLLCCRLLLRVHFLTAQMLRPGGGIAFADTEATMARADYLRDAQRLRGVVP
jgi:hypothetical protein